jgi:stage V sporulation protein S
LTLAKLYFFPLKFILYQYIFLNFFFVTNQKTIWRGGCMEVLKVAATSMPQKVANALAAIVKEQGEAELQAVGASAVNQAVKAIAIARGKVAPNGIDLYVIPAFADIVIDGEKKTAIKFIVKSR